MNPFSWFRRRRPPVWANVPDVARTRGGTGVADERAMTVGFTNFRDWVGLCERVGDRAAVELLNGYVSAIVPVLRREGGFYLDLIGDRFHFAFNAFEPVADYAQAAVRAATVFRAEAVKLGARHPGVGVDIGLATGRCIRGEIFGRFQVLGAPVNLASRLASLPATGNMRLMVDQATHEAVKGHYPFRPHTEKVLGIDEPVTYYELLEQQAAAS